MAVPTQDELHRQLLAIAAQSSIELSRAEFRDAVIFRMSLTESDLQERTKTHSSKLTSNLGFALSLLARAGMLDRPSKGRYLITEQGKRVLTDSSGPLSTAFLRRLAASKEEGDDGQEKVMDTTLGEDPEKQLEDGYKAIRDNLESDLLDSLLNMSPDGFESLVLVLLKKLGYGEGRVVGRSGDGGIDVEINQDALGLDKIYAQAKRWRPSVGAPEIRNFSGSLQSKGAAKGVFVTTSHFTPAAIQVAGQISQSNQTLLLIDGKRLAELMFDHDVGVITEQTYAVKKLDENYFSEF